MDANKGPRSAIGTDDQPTRWFQVGTSLCGVKTSLLARSAWPYNTPPRAVREQAGELAGITMGTGDATAFLTPASGTGYTDISSYKAVTTYVEVAGTVIGDVHCAAYYSSPEGNVWFLGDVPTHSSGPDPNGPGVTTFEPAPPNIQIWCINDGSGIGKLEWDMYGRAN